MASENYGIRQDSDQPGSELMMSDVVFGYSRVVNNGNSLFNEANAAAMANWVNHLIKEGAHPKDIGMLTYYNGQKPCVMKHLREVIHPSGELGWEVFERLELSSVDAFQGQECEYTAVDFVIGRQKPVEDIDEDDDDNGGESF